MSKPLFSLIVTIYNQEKYLTECLESLINQTYKNIEIVLIDDGSKDGSMQICKKYANKDSRVVLFHKKNGGLTRARMDGISKSTADYIIFVDGDDWIDDKTCERYSQIIHQTGVDIVVDGLIKEFDGRRQKSSNVIAPGLYNELDIKEKILRKMIYSGNYYEKGIESYICSKAVKREIMMEISKSINPDISFGEGGVWIYTAMLLAKKVMLIEDLMYHYRMHNDSMALTRVEEDKIFSVYENLAQNISRYSRSRELLMQIDYMAFFFLIWKNPELFNRDTEVFFPYKQIKRTSRIVIYGAWRYGKAMYEFIKKSGWGKIVLVVDQNAEQCSTLQYQVYKPEKIKEVEYDYIILGSEVYSVVCSMKKRLAELGITNNIVYIENDDIDVKLLPQKYQDCKLGEWNGEKFMPAISSNH